MEDNISNVFHSQEHSHNLFVDVLYSVLIFFYFTVSLKQFLLYVFSQERSYHLCSSLMRSLKVSYSSMIVY